MAGWLLAGWLADWLLAGWMAGWLAGWPGGWPGPDKVGVDVQGALDVLVFGAVEPDGSCVVSVRV